VVPYFFFFSKNTSNSKSADPMDDTGTWRHRSTEGLGAEGEERQVMRADCMLISLFMGAARFPQRIPLTCGV
jgi:hypothetical protein